MNIISWVAQPDPELMAIERALRDPSMSPISMHQVRTWISSNNIVLLGAVFTLLHSPQQYRRVTPPPTFEDFRRLHIVYLRRCIVEDPDTQWTETRYIAGYSLAKWFTVIWDDPKIPKDANYEIKTLLAELCRSGDAEIQRAVVTAVLEHLFESQDIRAYFMDWENDPELRAYFREASEYAFALANRPSGIRAEKSAEDGQQH